MGLTFGAPVIVGGLGPSTGAAHRAAFSMTLRTVGLWNIGKDSCPGLK